MKLIALYFSFFALLLVSCNKPDPVSAAPEIPTFKCNINLHDCYPTHMVADLKGPEWVEIFAHDSQYAIHFLIDDSTDLIAKHEFISNFHLAYVEDKQSNITYSTDIYPPQNTGYLEITTIDTIKKTLSGSFAFTAYNTEGFSTVVKNGVLLNVPFIE
jgi:hypothetical protein